MMKPRKKSAAKEIMNALATLELKIGCGGNCKELPNTDGGGDNNELMLVVEGSVSGDMDAEKGTSWFSRSSLRLCNNSMMFFFRIQTLYYV